MTNRTIIIKNNKVTDDYWVGRLIVAGDQYQLESQERYKWAFDDKVITDIQSGDLIVNDGTSDLSASQGELWLTAEFLLEVNDSTTLISKFVETLRVATGLNVTSITDTLAEVKRSQGSGIGTYDEVMEFGNGGSVSDQFLNSAGSAHTSKDSCPLALADGEIVHVTISTEKYPERVWDLQIITNATKDGAGTYAGGTQIGTNLNKPASQLDIVYTNLSGFTFSAGDRIQTYAKKNPDDAIEPLVRLFVRYN